MPVCFFWQLTQSWAHPDPLSETIFRKFHATLQWLLSKMKDHFSGFHFFPARIYHFNELSFQWVESRTNSKKNYHFAIFGNFRFFRSKLHPNVFFYCIFLQKTTKISQNFPALRAGFTHPDLHPNWTFSSPCPEQPNNSEPKKQEHVLIFGDIQRSFCSENE